MRISSRAYLEALNIHLSRASQEIQRLSMQISSGRRLSKPSDDPLAVLAIVDARVDLARTVNRQKVLAKGERLTSVADVALDAMGTGLRRVRDIGLGGTQPGLDDNARHALATEIRTVRHALIDHANASVAGDCVFAGRWSSTPPFEEVGGVVSYTGTSEGAQLWVAPGRPMEVTIPGDRLFNFEDAGGTRAVPAVDRDMFALLEDLAAAIEAGNDAETVACMTDFDALSGHVTQQRGVLGARAARLATAQQSAADVELHAQEILTNVEGVDMVEAMLNLQNQELAYQAALAAVAKMVQLPTLFQMNW